MPSRVFLKIRVLLVVAEDFQALHEGKASVDHDRELAEEDGLLLGLDGAAANLKIEALSGALLLDDIGLNALTGQRCTQYLFVFGGTLALNFFARRIISLIGKNRHSNLSDRLILKLLARRPFRLKIWSWPSHG